MRRRLIAASVLVAACASAGPPPGGPEDRLPPKLVHVAPDTNAVNYRGKDVTFTFDEQINNRGAGESDIDAFFLVSPNDGPPRVRWHRTRIEVRPRHGFRPNTAYAITMLPGLSDLRNNRMKTGAEVVFSTGATIPTLRIQGYIFDWVAERPASDGLVEAITPDSIVYVAQADSVGHFSVGPLAPGTYLMRGTLDQNHNRKQDRTEAWDTVRVSAPLATPLQLLTAPRDTLPARIQGVALTDSTTLNVTFDRLLDPTQPFPAASFRLVLIGTGADSVVIPIVSTRTPREERQRQQALEAQVADSARRADSLAGRPRRTLPRLPAARDTTVPEPNRPGPFTTLSLIVGRLAPSTTYRLSVTSIRALSGRVTGSERQFTTPKPPPPPRPDSTGAAAPNGRPPAPAPTTPPTTPPPTRPNPGP